MGERDERTPKCMRGGVNFHFHTALSIVWHGGLARRFDAQAPGKTINILASAQLSILRQSECPRGNTEEELQHGHKSDMEGAKLFFLSLGFRWRVDNMIQRKEEEGDTDDKDRDGGGGAEAVFVLPARLPARPPVLPFPSFPSTT